MPKPCARHPATRSFSLPASLPGRLSTIKLVVLEMTSQPMASTAWQSALLMIGVFRGFSVPPVAQDDAQRLVKRRHRIAGVRPVIDGHRHIPAVDNAPVTR